MIFYYNANEQINVRAVYRFEILCSIVFNNLNKDLEKLYKKVLLWNQKEKLKLLVTQERKKKERNAFEKNKQKKKEQRKNQLKLK